VNYRFLSPAKLELVEAVEFYEDAVPGLGLEFLDEVERTEEGKRKGSVTQMHLMAWQFWLPPLVKSTDLMSFTPFQLLIAFMPKIKMGFRLSISISSA